MFKSFAAVAAIALLSAPATAATIMTKFELDLNNSGKAYGGDTYGNYRTYAITAGSGTSKMTVNVRASAWSWNGTTLTNAYLGNNTASNGGLYDINRYEGNGANNTHTIDNQSGADFILFQFDKNVQLTGVTANAFPIGNTPDNDLTIGRSVSLPANASWNSAPAGWNGKAVSDLSSLFQAQKNIDSSKTGSTLDAYRVLNPAGSSIVSGKVWMISASLVNSDHKIDAFKLDQLKFQTNSSMGVLGVVPEPASWAMLIGGFGMIGGVARRRKVMLSKLV